MTPTELERRAEVCGEDFIKQTENPLDRGALLSPSVVYSSRFLLLAVVCVVPTVSHRCYHGNTVG